MTLLLGIIGGISVVIGLIGYGLARAAHSLNDEAQFIKLTDKRYCELLDLQRRQDHER